MWLNGGMLWQVVARCGGSCGQIVATCGGHNIPCHNCQPFCGELWQAHHNSPQLTHNSPTTVVVSCGGLWVSCGKHESTGIGIIVRQLDPILKL